MTHTVDWGLRRVCVRYVGRCTADEVLGVVVALQSDRRFDTIHQALHDFSRCEGMAYSVSDLEEIAALNSASVLSNASVWIAVITGRKDVIDMLKAFESVGLNPYPICVFSTSETADAWLNAAKTTGQEAIAHRRP